MKDSKIKSQALKKMQDSIVRHDMEQLRRSRETTDSVRSEILSLKNRALLEVSGTQDDPSFLPFSIKRRVWIEQRLQHLHQNLATAHAIELEKENQLTRSKGRFENLKKVLK